MEACFCFVLGRRYAAPRRLRCLLFFFTLGTLAIRSSLVVGLLLLVRPQILPKLIQTNLSQPNLTSTRPTQSRSLQTSMRQSSDDAESLCLSLESLYHITPPRRVARRAWWLGSDRCRAGQDRVAGPHATRWRGGRFWAAIRDATIMRALHLVHRLIDYTLPIRGDDTVKVAKVDHVG